MNKNTWILLGLVVLAVFVYNISGILTPFVLAFVLAYALNPVVERVSKHVPRGVGAGVVVVAVLLFAISLVLVITPILQAQLMEFSLKMPRLVGLIWDKLKDILTYGKQNITEQQLYQLSDSVSGTVLNALQCVGSA